MADRDWYRRTTWGAEDESDFEQRLSGSRGQRSEYLRIQAVTLAETGQLANARPAIALAERYLDENPDGLFVGQAYATIAKAHTTLEDVDSAAAAYRSALQAERARPNVRELSYLDFLWLVATRRRSDLYDEALAVIPRDLLSEDLVHPAAQYHYFGALALISEELGDHEYAARMARNALVAAGRKRGYFRRHPSFGLVRGGRDEARKRIEELAR